MSLIKLEVSVNADNALVVAEFIKSLAECTPKTREVVVGPEAIEVKDAEEVKPEEPKKEPAKRASRAKKPEPVEEEQTEEEQTEEEQTEKTSDITVDDIRTLQAQKVTAHRDAIIEKFKKLGAKGISSLDEDHFEEYYNFLKGLK